MNGRILKAVLLASVSTSAVSWSAALAAEEGEIPTVIVTAQKHAEDVQRVPISIATLGAAELQARGITSLSGALAAIPSIATVSAYGSTQSQLIYMRGMGSSAPSSANSEAAIGLYEDGYYLARSSGLGFDLGDIERIEVLRGPQGTLYGMNTTGGAVNIISKKPSGQFGVKQELDFGNRSMFRTSTVVDLPALERLSAKVSLLKSGIDGWVKNRGPGNDFGLENQKAGKLQLRLVVSDDVTIDYAGSFGRQDSTTAYLQNPQFDGTIVTMPHYDATGTVVRAPYLYRSAGPQKISYRPFDVGIDRVDLHSETLTAAWEPSDALSLRSFSGFRRTNRSNGPSTFSDAFETGGLLLEDAGQRANVDNKQFSQELQAAGDLPNHELSYTVGGFYFHEKGEQRLQGEYFAIDGIGAFQAGSQHFRSRSRSRAVYGQLVWRPAMLEQRFDVTLGGRYSWDYRWGARDSLITATNPDGSLTKKASKFTPSITANYQWTDDISTYARFATGYRAGGVNFGQIQPSFDPEKLKSYEVGLKSYWLDRRVRLNAALFENRFTDMQLNIQGGGTTSGKNGNINIGKARIRGLELDALANVTRDLSLTASWSWLDAKVLRVPAPANTIYTAAPAPFAVGADISQFFVIPFVPHNSISIGADYVLHPFATGDLTAHLDYRWQGSTYQLPNLGPAAVGRDFGRVASFGLLNGRLTYATDVASGRASVSVWGKNILNKRYVQTALGNTDDGVFLFTSAAQIWAPPATYGVSLSYQF